MRALVGASSVDSVVRVTGNFASEGPLHPAAREALLAAFDQGWADPKKISQSASKAAILRNHALENIAEKLGVSPAALEVIGEPALGHYLSIAGLFNSQSPFAYSAVDKGKIRAIARAHHFPVHQLEVNESGSIVASESIPENSVISLQLANGETGVIQDQLSAPSHSRIAVDATSSGARVPLPDRWDTALFDSLSWNGPSGLAIMAIKNRSEYLYPLPRIAPISVPGSYSLPLLIASSIALENFQVEDSSMRKIALEEISRLEGIQVVAREATALPHIFSVVVSGAPGEAIVRELASRDIDVDSGSACSPEDLQPSHVLAAMGYETNGHLRFTLHAGTNEADINSLVKALKEVLHKLRG